MLASDLIFIIIIIIIIIIFYRVFNFVCVVIFLFYARYWHKVWHDKFQLIDTLICSDFFPKFLRFDYLKQKVQKRKRKPWRNFTDDNVPNGEYWCTILVSIIIMINIIITSMIIMIMFKKRFTSKSLNAIKKKRKSKVIETYLEHNTKIRKTIVNKWVFRVI